MVEVTAVPVKKTKSSQIIEKSILKNNLQQVIKV